MLTTEHQVPANYFCLHYSFFSTCLSLNGRFSFFVREDRQPLECEASLTLAFFLSVILLEAYSAFCTCEIYHRTTDSLSFPFLEAAVVIFPEFPILFSIS